MIKSFLSLGLTLALFGTLVVACGGGDDPPSNTTKTGSSSGQICNPNQTVYCRCGPESGNAAGDDGYQTCARDGKSFGACGPCVASDVPPTPTASCGNNTREGSEECDDGNQVDTDGCTSQCKYAVCGDKLVYAGKEECDDGNTMSGDGCSAAYKKETATSDPCDGEGEACDTGDKGECGKGTFVCDGSALFCVASKTAAATDTCGNGLDDDCNGKVDDGDCPCAHDMCDEGTPLPAGCAFTSGKSTNAACHETICQKDGDICCGVEWDATCVKAVQLFCGRLSCEASKGACSHTLCSAGAALTPECDKGNGTAAVTSCVTKICNVDPACCTDQWDQACIDRVINVCGKQCDR